MTDKKIKLKIGRQIYNIGAKDIIMITQKGPFRDYSYTVPTLSKKLFKDLKTCCFIFEDQELAKKYSNLKLVYYRFNIERMIEMGYEFAD